MHRSRRDRFPSHDFFFASGRTNRAKSENSKHIFFWASSEAKRTTVREISLWREPTHSFLDFLDILPDLADDPSGAFLISRIRDTHRLPALLIHQLYLPQVELPIDDMEGIRMNEAEIRIDRDIIEIQRPIAVMKRTSDATEWDKTVETAAGRETAESYEILHIPITVDLPIQP